MTKAVTIPEPPVSDAAALLATIIKVGADATVDAGKIERMWALWQQMDRQRREDAFNVAMRSAQAAMPQMFRDKENTHKSYKYATLESLNAKAVPVYTEHGFSLSFGTQDCPTPNHYRMVCKVSHIDGFSRDYQADLPTDMLGDKGNPNKTAIQGFGSSMSYGRRYMTMLIFNITTTGEDDDGEGGRHNGPTGAITIEQRDTLAKIIENNGFPIDGFLKWAGVATLAEIPAASFGKAHNALLAKVAAKVGK